MEAEGSDCALKSHFVLIPSYNTGQRLFETVAEARRYSYPVWVVIDGSTDGTGETLVERTRKDNGVRVFCRSRNGGKGAAVLDGLREATAEGFTHVLVMDADGQHPASMIPEFMVLSAHYPKTMILGVPVFDRSAPRIRVVGRRVSNSLVKLETLGAIDDSLFGFRVYPVLELMAVLQNSRWMRRYDFDAEAAMRLSWRGVSALNKPAPVRYFRTEEGGVSHFRYGRDNLILTLMHLRLLLEFLPRLPVLAARAVKSSRR